jgi:hypothetical protein
MAFDRTECVARLKRARETQPENAAVLLEEARLAALVDDGPKEAMELVRDAVRKRVYERSYFVGIPEILRGPISRSAVVRRRTEKAWPDSSWLFTTLQDSERLQSSPRGQIELRLLQLQLGDLLCRAPDYWDQAVGIHQKTLVLRRLASMVDALPAEQRALLRIQAEDHARLYADYPTRLTSMVLNREGITVSEYPQTQVERPGSLRGIHISPPGMVSW